MPLADHFRLMQSYETWANKATLDSMDSTPPASRSGMSFTRALQVMAHNQLARSVWLARVQGRVEKPADWFPAWPLAEIRAKAAALDLAWKGVIDGLTDSDLTRLVSYTSSEGVAYQSSVHEILSHLFNHSTYHRGQVARLVSEAGGRRATTDFIAMNRRPG